MMAETTISIVTPTLYRPDEVMGMLDNLCKQEYLPTKLFWLMVHQMMKLKLAVWLKR